MSKTFTVQAIMAQQRFRGMKTIEVIANTVREGLGTEESVAREVVYYMRMDGTLIGNEGTLSPIASARASFEKEQAKAVEQVKSDASAAASKARIGPTHCGSAGHLRTSCGLTAGPVSTDWSKVDCNQCWFHKGYNEGADQ